MTVLDIAGNQRSPRDDGAEMDRGEGEDDSGRVGAVELGIHVDEMIREECIQG